MNNKAICQKCGVKMNCPKSHATLCYDCTGLLPEPIKEGRPIFTDGKIRIVEWTTHWNPISPNVYSKEHFTKDGLTTICGRKICPVNNPKFKEYEGKQSFKEMLEEENDRINNPEPGTIGNGFYCLRCLRKLS